MHSSAWAERDPERTEVLFAADCVYVWHPFRDPRLAAAGVASYVRGAFATQDKVQITFGSPIVGQSSMAVEYWMTFVQVEESKPFTIAGAQMVSFDADGRARSVHDYWHSTKGEQDLPPWFCVARQ